ncbi:MULTISPECIES: hypothetical protein, partial [Blautia]|uniref:hypothetical protein n=1 Tax=Blautia TaxID=572511 RepID=UPI00197A8C6A
MLLIFFSTIDKSDSSALLTIAEFSTTLETGIIIGKKEDLPMEPRMELINSVLAAMTALLAAE